jgi:hypothetical protein
MLQAQIFISGGKYLVVVLFCLFNVLNSLRTPSATERLEKGQSLWYIQSSVEVSSAEVQSSSSSSLHFSEQPYTLQRVAARVLAVHKETGSDPYYSIETTGPAKSGGDGGGRELQTEWHK